MNLYLYILLLCYFFLTSIFCQRKKKNNYIFYISGFILILCATFRPVDINIDTTSYVNYFKTVPSIRYLFSYDNFQFEKGYVFLNMIIHSLGVNYNIFLFLIASFSISLIMITIYKNTKYIYVSLLVYFTNFYFLNELLIMRTGMATALVFFSFKYLKKNKIKYLFMILIAFLLHRISLVALLPLLLDILKFMNRKFFVYSSIVLAYFIGQIDFSKILVLNFRFLLPQKVLYYFINYIYTSSSYRQLILLLPIFLYFYKNKEKYKNEVLFDESLIFLYLSIITKLLFIKHEAFNRISSFYLMGLILLPSIYLQKINNKWLIIGYKILISFFFILLCIWYLRGENVIKLII